MNISPSVAEDWDKRPVSFNNKTLGINLPWETGSDVSYINTSYDSNVIQTELDAIYTTGVRKIRTFITVDAVYEYSGGADGDFTINAAAAANVADYLGRIEAKGMQVILVMAHHGNTSSQPASLDGHVQWSLFQTEAGRQKYAAIYADFVQRFSTCGCIMAWELMNEPYGGGTNMGFSSYATSLSLTEDEVHEWLKLMYSTVKDGTPAGTIVCFSEYQEEEQEKYQTFNDGFRATYIDDCTDVFSMHIYRPGASYMADFRTLNSKPKWLIEVGHLNYSDPNAESHPIAGNNELYTKRNAPATRDIMRKALNSGFELIMPWSASDNDHIIKYNADSSYSLGNFGQWIKSTLADRS